MFCNCIKTALLFLVILNTSLCRDFENMKPGAMRNTIDDLLNEIGTMKGVKTDDILAFSNGFGLRMRENEKKDLDKMLRRLKLAVFDSYQNKKVSYLDDDLIESFKQALRINSDSDDDNESDHKIQSDDNNSNENLNIPNKIRKDTVRNYDCEYWKDECVEACKEAYREACYIEDCRQRLRRRLRRYCKRYCTMWFY